MQNDDKSIEIESAKNLQETTESAQTLQETNDEEQSIGNAEG